MIEFKNEPIYKPNITKELILQHYNSYDIFRFYCGEFTISQNFSSPLRTDQNPSFNIFMHKSGELFYNDFLLGAGDFVKFIREKFSLNYYNALSKICIDLKLNHLYSCNEIANFLLTKSEPKTYNVDLKQYKSSSIQIKSRKWVVEDLNFWKQFGIGIKTLNKYSVIPITHIFIGDSIIKADNYSYAFVENKDGFKTYTIYRPYNEQKWLKDHDSSVWYSWEQLPKTDEVLIITKSKKDIMSINDVLSIPATALQNEKIIPKQKVVQELIERFPTIYLLYDNDYDKEENWGRMFGKKFADKYGLTQIEIPERFKSKDFSDLVKNFGVEKSKEIFQDIINNILPF